MGKIMCLFSFDTTRNTQTTTPPTILHCRGNVFTEALPSTKWRDTLNLVVV
jgi:hypothetical protein